MNRRRYEPAPPIPADIDERLRNWARVYRDRKEQGTTPTAKFCERLAREAGVVPPRPLVIDPDTHDAMLVEKAWRSSLMPEKPKAMLKSAYVLNRPPGVAARHAGIPIGRYDAELYRAAMMIRNILETVARRH